jgi:hypothetical protein
MAELGCRTFSVPDKYARPQFQQLLSKSQSWYKLLPVLGFKPGDTLPCSLEVPFISPADAAADTAIQESTRWAAEVTTKVSESKEEGLVGIQKEKDRITKNLERALNEGAIAKAKREADQKDADEQREADQREADEKEKERVERKHQRQIKEQEEAAELANASAVAAVERVRIFKVAIAAVEKKRLDGEDITNDDVQTLAGYMRDPIIGPYIDQERSATLADIINANATFRLSQLSTSQSSTVPAATPIVKKSKHGSRQIVDLTYSDDDHDGVDIVLKSQLRQIPWKSHGLSTAIVTPTLYAIKNITQEDQMLLTNNSNAHDIIALGIQAWRERDAAKTESSGGSDGSKRSYSMGPGAKLPKSKSKKKKRMEIDFDAFTASVVGSSASAKAKGKKRATPRFTSSDDEEASNAADDEE